MSHTRPQTYRFEQFAAVTRVHGLDFSPDGQELIYVADTSGQFNVWKQQIKGGEAVQLTTFKDESVRTVAWSPIRDEIIFSADRYGSEHFQVYKISSRGGSPQLLTHASQAQHYFEAEGWSPDGQYITYASNARDPNSLDVIVHNIETGETECILKGEGTHFPISWSPNGRFILIVHFINNTNTDILVYDLQARELLNETAHTGQVLNFPGPWARDSSGYYLITDREGEFKGLGFYDLARELSSWVDRPQWDVEDIAISHQGEYLAWVVNNDGLSELQVRNQIKGHLVSLPYLGRGIVDTLLFSPTGPIAAFYFNAPGKPRNVFLLNIESREIDQLTHFQSGVIRNEDLLEPELVRYSTFDGKWIPAWLYRPETATSSSKVPMLVSIHGGPEIQERPTYNYSGLYQYLASQGIGVLAPNIRGSSGYGKSYQRLIRRDLGGGDLRDIQAAANYLQGLDWVDSDRLGIFGISYGGFAALSAIARIPQYWAAAVVVSAPSDLVTLTERFPPVWRDLIRELVGDPLEDRESLISRSPITYFEHIGCPVLIIHGTHDPRVLRSDSDELVQRMQKLGKDVEYLVFEDEGHWFTHRRNEIATLKAMAEFLQLHLLK